MELYNIDLCLTKLTFAGIYQIHLQYQENFDFFIALNVPKARDNSNSVTPPIIVGNKSGYMELLRLMN